MKCDGPKVGNSLKYRRPLGELKKCVTITAITKRFPLKKGKSIVIAERKQYRLILGHPITVHKSQRSTLSYMQDDFNWSSGKKTANEKRYQQPISRVNFTLYFPVPKIEIRFYC